jgi:3-methyladenine DNA glycosylase AlkC
MAEALRDAFGPEVPERIAGMLLRVNPGFPRERFLALAIDGLEPLALTDRARHVSRALAATLPAEPEEALALLVASLGPSLEERPATGMESFVYLPHVYYVADHGLECFDAAMAAQHEITRRFTCEFSIRPFIDAEPERTLAVLAEWTRDPSEHVRRLVSEGTRPRLPWAPRLRRLQRDPSPIVPLLEALRDDRSEYVRRSVANNLNDISKDHPDLVVALAERWLDGAPPERRRLVRHALRGLIKAGDPGALRALGYRPGARAVARVRVAPATARIGESIEATVEIDAPERDPEPLVVDLRVHFVKARGATGAKVFKIRELAPAPGERIVLRKRISLRQHTTRTHHPGEHRVEVLVNGAVAAEGRFVVVAGNEGPA